MHGFKLLRLLTPFLLLSCLNIMAQNTDQEKYDALKNVINNKQFRFLPQSATTMKGSTLPVDPGYELKLMTDSLRIDFPYFESGYTTNFGASDDVIKFSSKEFSYSAEMTKKGGWNINIIPKDISDIKRVYMTITPEGYCTLRVNCNKREPISYFGVIADNLSH